MNTQNETLNGSTLKTIAHSTPTAEVIMLSLALRERMRQSSDLAQYKRDLLKQGNKIVDEDYKKVWRDLEKAGMGSIVYGRNGKSDKFKWHYSLKSVAKAAIEGTDEVVKVFEKKHTAIETKPAPKKRGRPFKKKTNNVVKQVTIVEQGTNTLYIPLRPSFNFKLDLPKDITSEELATIQNALKSL